MIKLLALVEASTVTGPAKNLIEFSRRARDLDRSVLGLPPIETSIITFDRRPEVRSVSRAGDSRRNEPFFSARPAAASRSPNRFVTAAREAGIEVDLVDERFRFDPRVISHLREIVELQRPDIVQTHSVKSHFLLRLSGLWRERPWVAFHHGYTTTDLKMRAYNQLDRWSLRAADRVITTSHAFARDLARKDVAAERIRVLHNSTNANWSPERKAEGGQTLRAALGITDRERVVLAVGRLSHEKAHVDAVTAIAHLRCSQPQIKTRLIILGNGPERQRIEDTAASLGVREQVILAGQVNDLSAYYALADVLAHPSLSEGSPNVLLEAMAAGLPIVATVVGGVTEIVKQGESALLVKPRDPRALARAIGLILAHTQFASELAANARNLAINRHSHEARLHSLAGIYCELVSGLASAEAKVG